MAASKLLAEIRDHNISEILNNSLHAYLTKFLDKINQVGLGISQDFLLPLEDAA